MGLPKPKRTQNKAVLDAVRGSSCRACGKPPPSDPSHIYTRKSGGPDSPWNVFAKCRSCHYAWHQMGPARFCKKYPAFEWALKSAGWEWLNGKLFHPGKNKQT